MTNLKSDALSELQAFEHNEKRLVEVAALENNNRAIHQFNYKINHDWKLRRDLNVSTFALITDSNLFIPPYYFPENYGQSSVQTKIDPTPSFNTIDITLLIESLTEFGNLVLINGHHQLDNQSAGFAIDVWNKSRSALEAYVLNYDKVTGNTQDNVNALNETIKATMAVIKNPKNMSLTKALLQKNDFMTTMLEPNHLQRSARSKSNAEATRNVYSSIHTFACFATLVAAFCVLLTLPLTSTPLCLIAVGCLVLLLGAGFIRDTYTSKSGEREIYKLREAANHFAKSVAPNEYLAYKAANDKPWYTPISDSIDSFFASGNKTRHKALTLDYSNRPRQAKL